MNVWFAASAAFLILLVPCTWLAVRGNAVERITALSVASALAVLALLTVEQGLERGSFFDVSLALAVLSFPSTLLFARVYRRWL